MANTSSNASLRPQIWLSEVMKDVMDNLYFMKKGLMGPGENNIVITKTELTKSKGDRVNFPLTYKLSGEGVDGDGELEGNEEEIEAYAESVLIDQKRFAVRLTGVLDEQKNAYDMRVDAKAKLAVRMKEFIERQIFLKMAGVTNTTLVDVNGLAYSAGALWSNTPDFIPDADEAAGYGPRYLCADFTNGTDSLATTDLITPQLISRLKIKAQLARPKIQPLMVDGEDIYILFIHPWQGFDLRENPQYNQAVRDADVRGKDNPLFRGSFGLWDGVLIIPHEYVPFLDISVSGNSFRGAATGTDCTADAFRAILVGKCAVGYAQCKNPAGMVEKKFDYDNQTGFAVSLIGGIQKLVFNGLEYGEVVLDTAATSLV